MLQRKNLSYYQAFDYTIIVEKETQDNESWYIAYSTELGKHACYGRGNSPEEAVESYKNEKYDFINFLFQNRKPIPEPEERIEEVLLSGFFNVRTTPELHTLLAKHANIQGVSLNQYVNILLASKSGGQQVSMQHQDCLQRIEKKLDFHHSFVTRKLDYSFKGWPDRDQVINPMEALNYSPEAEYFQPLLKKRA
jgi:predicted HicB family RNase H-like nuclease